MRSEGILSWQSQLEKINSMDLHYFDLPEFQHERRSAEKILSSLPKHGSRAKRSLEGPGAYSPELVRIISKLPRFTLTSQEAYDLFFYYNFLKWRASELRTELLRDPNTPQARDIASQVFHIMSCAQELRNRIIEANLGLIVAAVRLRPSLLQGGVTVDDAHSEGTVILLRVVDKFDFRRGFQLSTYAMAALLQSLPRALRNRHAREIPYGDLARLEGLARHDEDPGLERMEETDRENALRASLQDLLDQAELDERQRAILEEYFGEDDMTYAAIGALYGIKKQRVQQIIGFVLNKVRKVKLTGPFGVGGF